MGEQFHPPVHAVESIKQVSVEFYSPQTKCLFAWNDLFRGGKYAYHL